MSDYDFPEENINWDNTDEDNERAEDDPQAPPVAPQPLAAPQISQADLGSLMSFFGELADRMRTPKEPPPPKPEKKEKPPKLQYPNAVVWFDEWCRHVYRRRLPGRGASPAWREDWWKDPEARTRIDAIWRAWEKLRLDPATGMSVWFKDHGDYHMGALFGEYGPFTFDESPRNDLGSPLPHVRPDDALLGNEQDTPAPGFGD